MLKTDVLHNIFVETVIHYHWCVCVCVSLIRDKEQNKSPLYVKKKERKKSVTGNLDTQDIHFTLFLKCFFIYLIYQTSIPSNTKCNS